jgi:hypothetical protein
MADVPLCDGVEVYASSIHGYGGRTTRAFRAGETVCFGDGVLYAQDDDFDDTYALIVDDDRGKAVFWDLVDQTRWFNHSCDPNTEVMSRFDHERRTVIAWWVAIRDVAAGEEITYDYGFVADVAEPCACGTSRCRGLIVDSDPEEQAKLAPHLRTLLRVAC